MNNKNTFLILSDSHGDYDGLIEIIYHHQKNIAGVIFLGDGAEEVIEASFIFPEIPLYAVTGNNDIPAANRQVRFPLERIMEIGKEKIYLTHGHIAGYDSVATEVVRRAKESGAKIALHGHLHVPCSKIIDGVHLISPGSIRYPRGGSEKSYAILSLNGGNGDLSFYHAVTHQELTVPVA